MTRENCCAVVKALSRPHPRPRQPRSAWAFKILGLKADGAQFTICCGAGVWPPVANGCAVRGPLHAYYVLGLP
eukprot:scaffold8972_cov118-Isochrysis_galbana.AAC.12